MPAPIHLARTARMLALLCVAAVPGQALAKTRTVPVGCAPFMDAFVKATEGHRATFERPLIITRGFFGDEDGVDVRVLSTDEDVEGTLKCRGDQFLRFEVRVDAPTGDKLDAAFKVYEQAALLAAFRWDRAKADTVVGAMSSDAAEYLRASIQRGDTYRAGKVEYHQGDALDLGLIWTESDRTFIVTAQDDG